MSLELFNGSWSFYDSQMADMLSLAIYESFQNDVQSEQESKRRFKRVSLWLLRSTSKMIADLWAQSRGLHAMENYY